MCLYYSESGFLRRNFEIFCEPAPAFPGVRGHAQDPPDGFRTRSPRLTTYHHRSPLFCGGVGEWGGGDGGGGGGGTQGVPAVVSRGSRACGVTPRTPPTGSAPDHLGSPPITTNHHHFVVVSVHTRLHKFTHVFTHVHARSRTFTHVHSRLHTFFYMM